MKKTNKYKFMPPSLEKLTSAQRWAFYFTFAGLPGINFMHSYGFLVAVVYEIIIWVPQQQLFDYLQLDKTLPYADYVKPR
jgi:hypothetical protein